MVDFEEENDSHISGVDDEEEEAEETCGEVVEDSCEEDEDQEIEKVAQI